MRKVAALVAALSWTGGAASCESAAAEPAAKTESAPPAPAPATEASGPPAAPDNKVLGAKPEGERLAAMRASPQWDGGGFENPQPLFNSTPLSLKEMGERPPHSVPLEPVVVHKVDASMFNTPPPSGLRVTWLGHSTTLIEIDGVRVLTDPVWGEFAGPDATVGPPRWYPAPLGLDELPAIDVVLISHDHYDHLDTPTIEALAKRDIVFVAPLGVGAHLEMWGVAPDKIVELDWWASTKIGELEVHCTPARHASGRGIFDQNRTLWAGFALHSAEHRVYFSGDTGLFPDMKAIGERLGPFDLTMIEVGAYGAGWPDWHIGPEQAIKAHTWLKGDVFLPIHWGLFDLAAHGWTEPIERVLVAAEAADVKVVSPQPGGSFEPAQPPEVKRWWPELSWRTAEQAPIVSTKVDP